MKTVLQLKTQVRGAIWASGEPENLVTAHDLHFQEAFGEIAKFVACEREDNVDVVRFCKTNYKMGMTVFAAPRGIITRIYTVANENFDDPVFIKPRKWPEPEQWARNLFLFPMPALTTLPKLPIGFQVADAENDSLYGRARTGVWAQYQHNIYIAPWIQSNELVVIEWKGIKKEWADVDLISPEIDYQKAVKLYVQFAHERDYGDLQRMGVFHNPASKTGLYDEALGDLMWECNERQKTPPDNSTAHERNRLCSELADDAPPTSTDGVIIADVGNLSLPGDDLDNVHRLVKSFGSSAMMAAGMAQAAHVDYDASAGNSFHHYMNPYGGIHGEGGDTKAFWPAISAYDYTVNPAWTTFKNFFTTPNNGRYYDVVVGDVHIFVINTDSHEPDGVTSGSTQGLWLQGRLATSTAAWKVVRMDLCPFGSVYQSPTLQWPFLSWGANMVICSQARNYERLDIVGLAVINNGLGGAGAIESAPAPVSSSKFIYAEKFGAGKLSANLEELLFEFFNVEGELVDSVTLTKP